MWPGLSDGNCGALDLQLPAKWITAIALLKALSALRHLNADQNTSTPALSASVLDLFRLFPSTVPSDLISPTLCVVQLISLPQLATYKLDFTDLLAYNTQAYSAVLAYMLVMIFDIGGAMYGLGEPTQHEHFCVQLNLSLSDVGTLHGLSLQC